MTLRDETVEVLRHYAGRRRIFLAQVPPDRKGAEACMRRIDDVIDRRPRPVAVAGDGEVLWSDSDPWVIAQAIVTNYDTGGILPQGLFTIVNNTGAAELVLPAPDKPTINGVETS